MKDFFVSYSTLDEVWAEWIAWELESAGYDIMLQKWDFTPGKNFAVEMNDAILYANKIILVLSKSFLLSDFTKSEWSSFFSIDPVGKKRKIIPIRVEDCQPTGLLKQIVYIDLVSYTEKEARKILLERIKSGRRKPTTKPVFPGHDIDASPLSPIFPGSEMESPNFKVLFKKLSELVSKFSQTTKGAPLIKSRQIGRAFVREALDAIVIDLLNVYSEISLLVVDVDGMSGINRKFGIEVGDQVMMTIAELTSKLPKRLLSGRLGDDVYFIILVDCVSKRAEIIAKDLLKQINSFYWNRVAYDLYVTCSAGIAQFNSSESANATVSKAVQALKVARTIGGNRVVRGPKYTAKRKERQWLQLLT